MLSQETSCESTCPFPKCFDQASAVYSRLAHSAQSQYMPPDTPILFINKKHEKNSFDKQFRRISHILIFSLNAKPSPEKTGLSSTSAENQLSLPLQGTEVKIKTSLPP